MRLERMPWVPPLVELPAGAVGHLLVWERNEANGTRRAWVSCAQETGGAAR